MIGKWLLRVQHGVPELSQTDPERDKFERDKTRIDQYFCNHGYKILCIDITKQASYQLPGKAIYILGKDFFQRPELLKKPINNDKVSDLQAYLLQAFDTIVMTLKCIKDLVQEINGIYYINPYAKRLQLLFELMGFTVKSHDVLSEGGLFLKGLPPNGDPFLIVSYEFIEHFKEVNLPVLRNPPSIGMDGYDPLSEDSHIDTYLGLINFHERLKFDDRNYNGVLYVHTDSLKFIAEDPVKREFWDRITNEMNQRGYLIREYTPTTLAQNIGINFKYDPQNHMLLTNAFPKKERTFLHTLGISVLAPEYDFSTNDSYSGGINCSYFLIPHNAFLETRIVDWIASRNK
ncbi:MAG: hypothetical protein ACTSQI_21660 [Candidatus Helarchaeota archaeon]